MKSEYSMQTISAQTNICVANVKRDPRGRKPKQIACAEGADGILATGQDIGMSSESPLNIAPNHGKPSRLADHILPSSATMIGVCMTVISLAHLIPKQSISRHVNELLALDSLLFLGSAMLSYFSIRRPIMAEKFERMADIIFLLGLAVMVVVGFIIAFELLVD